MVSDDSGSRTWRLLASLFGDVILVGGFALLLPIFLRQGASTDSLLRVGYAILYVFFVPGYAFVSAAFPHANSLDGLQRVTFAFGTSVAITSLTAIAFNFLSWGVRPVPLAYGLTALTIGLLALAAGRRWLIRGRADSRDEPFSLHVAPLWHVAASLRRDLTSRDNDGRIMTVATVSLVAAMLLAAGTVGYALSTPRPGEQYTEFALYTEDNGELVAGAYPSALVVGEPEPVVVSVRNHEFERVEYALVVRLRDPDSGRIERIRTIESIVVAHNETWQQPVSVAPPFAGTGLYVEFRLYRGSVADQPIHRLHLYVNATESGTASLEPPGPSQSTSRSLTSVRSPLVQQRL